MLTKNRKQPVLKIQNDAFNTSISDLMAGMLAIFVLALCFFILNFGQATAQLTQNNITRAKLLVEIQEEMNKQGFFDLKVDTKKGVLHIKEGILFDVGEAEIKPQGQLLIQVLSKTLDNVLTKDEYKETVETIFVEGHTDNVPIETLLFPSNWELSTKRAINTWLLLKKENNNLESMKNKNGEPLFSCSGYADTRPISGNDTEEGRQENRRIDLRFTMIPPADENLKIVDELSKRIQGNENRNL